MKKIMSRVLFSVLFAIVFMFAWQYFLNEEEWMESLVHAVSFSTLWPFFWLFGLFAMTKEEQYIMRPKRDRRLLYIIVGILTMVAFLLNYLGVGLGWGKSLALSLPMPVSGFLIVWIIYLIMRRNTRRRRKDTENI